MKNTKSARIIIIGVAILVVVFSISAIFFSANKDRRNASRSLRSSDMVADENDAEQTASAELDEDIEAAGPDEEIPEAALEKDLLELIKEKSGCVPEQTEFLDLNMDGKKEMVALCGMSTEEEYSFRFQVWFCNCDKKICELAEESSEAADYGELVVLQYDDTVHIVKNIYNMTGTLRYCSVCEMQQDELKALVSDLYGNIYEDADGNVMLLIDDYDGAYDPEIDGYMMHTTKGAYLKFDGKEYKEYTATKLSEQEFSGYENAKEVKECIENALYNDDGYLQYKREDVDRLEYTYYKRDNGIMQIQCDVYEKNGNIYFGYFTVKYKENELDTNIDFEDCYCEGIMKEKLTDLESAE